MRVEGTGNLGIQFLDKNTTGNCGWDILCERRILF